VKVESTDFRLLRKPEQAEACTLNSGCD